MCELLMSEVGVAPAFDTGEGRGAHASAVSQDVPLDKGEDSERDGKLGLPVSFSGVFNTVVTKDNVPTVLSKLQKWGDYESYGEPVGTSLFIPMKTPLSPTFLTGFPLVMGGVSGGVETHQNEAETNDTRSKIAATASAVPHAHTLPKFLEAQRRMGRDVGLIIDLSNHDCLYFDGIPDSGVERVHVRNVAKSIPDINSVTTVISIATKFWNATGNKNKHVAVHCAYGFNRTGFVLCCYLVEKCGLSAEEALLAFAVARNPGVKHERFRHALVRRYASGTTPVEDFDDNDNNNENNDDVGGSNRGDSAGDNSGFDTLEDACGNRETQQNTPGKENETLDLDLDVMDIRQEPREKG